jgi:transcriptional regulator with XRE-family HTH domain
VTERRLAFDMAAFRSAVQAVIQARGLTDRAAAREAGVGASTMTRCIRQEHAPDVHSLALLADWAELPLDAFVPRRRPIPETSLVTDKRRIAAAQRASAAAAEALGLLLAEEAR